VQVLTPNNIRFYLTSLFVWRSRQVRLGSQRSTRKELWELLLRDICRLGGLPVNWWN